MPPTTKSMPLDKTLSKLTSSHVPIAISHSKRILALTAIVYRPITLQELVALAKDHLEEDELLQESMGFCDSLVTIQHGTIYFIHQSAWEFLRNEAASFLFLSGIVEIHYAIFSRSLLAMSKALRRDIYGLKKLGYPIEEVVKPNPYLLVASRYSCIYWSINSLEKQVLSGG